MMKYRITHIIIHTDNSRHSKKSSKKINQWKKQQNSTVQRKRIMSKLKVRGGQFFDLVPFNL